MSSNKCADLVEAVNIVEHQDMGDMTVFAVLSKQSENPGANDADCAIEY